MPSTYDALSEQLIRAEAEKRKAEQAERERLNAEQEHRRKIAAQDAEIARLRAAALEAGMKEWIDRAQSLNGANTAAVRAVEDTMRELIDHVQRALDAPLAAADLAYKAVIQANNEVINIGIEQGNQAAPPPQPNYNGQPDYMAAEAQRNAVFNAFGRARGATPAPLLATQAALIGMSKERDPRRRLAWGALYYMLTGLAVSVDENYDPQAEALRAERGRVHGSRSMGF